MTNSEIALPSVGSALVGSGSSNQTAEANNETSADACFEFGPDAVNDVVPEKNISKFFFSFASWCTALVRKVLHRIRAFLSRTIYLSRDGPDGPSTAVFPLPLSNVWPIATGPSGSRSSVQRE